MLKRLFRPAHSGTGLGLAAIAAAALLWASGAAVASDLFDAGSRPRELTETRAVVAAAACS